MLQHLLREESIRIDLEAPDCESALRKMIGVLPSADLTSKQQEDLLKLLLQRERFGTTAVGDGVALPHCIFSGASFPLAALGISQHGIAYPSLDGEPVHLIFLVVLPQVEDVMALKQQIFQPVEGFFRDRFLRERLKASETVQEAYAMILREMQYGLPTLRVAQ